MSLSPTRKVLGGVMVAAALLVTLLAASPATAQSTAAQGNQYDGECADEVIVKATGTLEEAQTPYPDSTYAITDEASGCSYALNAGNLDLGQYAGQRVEVTGNTTAMGGGGEPAGEYQALLGVQEIKPLDRERGGETATLTFEVDTNGEAPEDATFFGFQAPAGSSGAPIIAPDPAQLTDPDGDGTYTESIELKKGSYAGVELVQGFGTVTGASAVLPGEPRDTLRGPETIDLNEDKTFSATADFSERPDDSANGGNTGDQYAPADGQPEDTSGGGDSEGGVEVLPDTGGASLLPVAGVGAALIGFGLLTRRILR